MIYDLVVSLLLPSLLFFYFFLSEMVPVKLLEASGLIGFAPCDHSDEKLRPTLVSQPNSYTHPESSLVIINEYFCFQAQ